LGNGSLFRSKWLGKLLAYFQVIPIYRKEDIRPGEVQDNQDSFRATWAYFDNGGAIVMFPEGNSYLEKGLRELRTGAARISISYENSREWKSGLLIVPISLHYSDPLHARTRVRVQVGDPFSIAEFKDLAGQDHEAAMRAITDRIEEKLAARLVMVEDREQEAMLGRVLCLRHEALMQAAKPVEAVQMEQGFVQELREWKAKAPKKYADLDLRLQEWFEKLAELGLKDGHFKPAFQRRSPLLLWVCNLLFLVLGLPLHLFGVATSYLPFWLPGWAAPRISSDIEYRASVLLVGWFLFFPIWYGVETLVFGLVSGLDWYWVLGFGLALPLAGAFAAVYWRQWERFRGIGAFLRVRWDRRLYARLVAWRGEFGDLQ
jgi:glycerol-3-phosphate O-acyltransferase / dihydroxyacetone phosphate acyltransferase